MSLGAARTRLRVGTISSLGARPKNSYSTKGSASGSGSFSSLTRYMTVAGLVGLGTPGLWWLANTRDDATREDAPYIEDPPAEHWSVEPGPSRDQVTRIIL